VPNRVYISSTIGTISFLMSFMRGVANSNSSTSCLKSILANSNVSSCHFYSVHANPLITMSSNREVLSISMSLIRSSRISFSVVGSTMYSLIGRWGPFRSDSEKGFQSCSVWAMLLCYALSVVDSFVCASSGITFNTNFGVLTSSTIMLLETPGIAVSSMKNLVLKIVSGTSSRFAM